MSEDGTHDQIAAYFCCDIGSTRWGLSLTKQHKSHRRLAVGTLAIGQRQFSGPAYAVEGCCEQVDATVLLIAAHKATGDDSERIPRATETCVLTTTAR